MQGLSEIEVSVQETSVYAAEQSRRADEQERYANEFRGVIKGMQGERDTWREMYFSAASGGEAAQVMMMREIERVTRLYQQVTGKRLPLNSTVAQVQEAFRTEHQPAIDEFRADGGKAALEAQHAHDAEKVRQIDAGGSAPASADDLLPVED